jgi:hypothetical protein
MSPLTPSSNVAMLQTPSTTLLLPLRTHIPCPPRVPAQGPLRYHLRIRTSRNDGKTITKPRTSLASIACSTLRAGATR